MILNLKKAFDFDTVSHSILLRNLSTYGISGNLLKFCKSYLTDRYQYVVYNDAKSERKIVTWGVPQGSILGPLFFLAYMNDIFNVSDFL